MRQLLNRQAQEIADPAGGRYADNISLMPAALAQPGRRDHAQSDFVGNDRGTDQTLAVRAGRYRQREQATRA